MHESAALQGPGHTRVEYILAMRNAMRNAFRDEVHVYTSASRKPAVLCTSSKPSTLRGIRPCIVPVVQVHVQPRVKAASTESSEHRDVLIANIGFEFRNTRTCTMNMTELSHMRSLPEPPAVALRLRSPAIARGRAAAIEQCGIQKNQCETIREVACPVSQP